MLLYGKSVPKEEQSVRGVEKFLGAAEPHSTVWSPVKFSVFHSLYVEARYAGHTTFDEEYYYFSLYENIV